MNLQMLIDMLKSRQAQRNPMPNVNMKPVPVPPSQQASPMPNPIYGVRG